MAQSGPRRRHWIAGGLGTLVLPGGSTQASDGSLPELRVRFPGGRSAQDRRYEAVEDLFVLAAAAAGVVVRIERVSGMTPARRLIELQQDRLDVGTLPSIAEPPAGLAVLRRPLRRGLLGVRLLIARQDRLATLAGIRNLAELKRLRLGYGSDWLDFPHMQALGFTLAQTSTYQSLFQFLGTGRSDWMHRGINEIWGELDTPGLVPAGVGVVPGIALAYPLDDYFCFSKRASGLVQPVALGLERMLGNGGYGRWFARWYGESLRRADLAHRRLLRLDTYPVLPGTPLKEFEFLPQPGRSGVPTQLPWMDR